MKKIKTFLELAYFVLDKEKTPLTSEQMWVIAQDLINSGEIQFSTLGKTPWHNIRTVMQMDMKSKLESTKFVQYAKPSRFFLKELEQQQDNHATSITISTDEAKASKLTERETHKYFTAWCNQEKDIWTKTIFHEKASKSKRNGEVSDKWLYPDLLGVKFSFAYNSELTELATKISAPLVKIYAYELKLELNSSNVKEYYFQAVSNSSWANEGYLVCANINGGELLLEELQRLTNSFGIGVIKLNLDNVLESEIIFPSKERDNIDLVTLNKLTSQSDDVKNFIKAINDSVKIAKVQENEFDRIEKNIFGGYD